MSKSKGKPGAGGVGANAGWYQTLSEFREDFDRLKREARGGLLAFDDGQSRQYRYRFWLDDAIYVARELQLDLCWHQGGVCSCDLPRGDVGTSIQRLLSKGNSVAICSRRPLDMRTAPASSAANEPGAASQLAAIQSSKVPVCEHTPESPNLVQLSLPAWYRLKAVNSMRTIRLRAEERYQRRRLAARIGIELRKALRNGVPAL
jgi:hypothetical protein